LHFGVNVEMYWDYDDVTTVRRELEAVIHEASVARFSRSSRAKKIEQLTLPPNFDGYRNPLPFLLFKSNLLNLKKLGIPGFGAEVSMLEIEQVVRDYCPNLRHLECPSLRSMREGAGQTVCAFIRGCSGLESFMSESVNDALPVFLELVSRHHSTLEAIDIRSERVFSRDLQPILSRCKQLKRFWALSDPWIGSISTLAYGDIAQGDWVCTELRELGLTVNRGRPERDASDEQEEWKVGSDGSHVCSDTCRCIPKRAFQQIGRMKNLEVLTIAIDRRYRAGATEDEYALDLTLSNGWLRELAGLKRLKSFRLRADFWRAMGQAEVEFMHEHWPLLNEVTIWCQMSSFQ
ncbi:hypothetical protein BGZ70_004377, partial [Mortierella alpina]